VADLVARELPDQKTVATREEVLEALWRAWLVCFGEAPKKESIWILMSQWALETGWGKSMHCFNFGNVKSREGDGFDFCYFACNEILKNSVAQKYQAANPDTAKITSVRSDGTSIIWFYPKHPGCRFRAFETLFEGAIDHLVLIRKRFNQSWPAVLAGDPAQYGHMLRVQKYYTADESSYVATLSSVFKTLSRMAFDYTALPTSPEVLELSEAQTERLAGTLSGLPST
jgi:hypothetical protein